jgi:hypothetical protein
MDPVEVELARDAIPCSHKPLGPRQLQVWHGRASWFVSNRGSEGGCLTWGTDTGGSMLVGYKQSWKTI